MGCVGQGVQFPVLGGVQLGRGAGQAGGAGLEEGAVEAAGGR